MELQMLYWHWLVLGVVLIVAEIFIPSFTILWFGLGALVVGVAARSPTQRLDTTVVRGAIVVCSPVRRPVALGLVATL